MTDSITFLDALVAALQRAGSYNKNDQAPPAAILWPDKERQWAPLHGQLIGWEPDLNDGVRLNIRPFVTAGVLRSRFTVNWKVDRGTNPDGSERINDLHKTRSEKQAARRSYPKG